MFEKILQQIEREPDSRTIKSFFTLLEQEKNQKNRAIALAQLAKIRLRQNAFDAIKTIQCAFRVDPDCPEVLDIMQELYGNLGVSEITKAIRDYRNKKTTSEFAQSTVNEKTHASVISPQSEPLAASTEKTPKEITFNIDLPEVSQEPAEPSFSDFAKNEIEATYANKGTAIAKVEIREIPEPNLAIEGEELQELQENQPHITFSKVSSRRNYEMFIQFLHESKLDFRLLEFAEGFSDSPLGLIHFVHYLKSTDKIGGHAAATAVSSLRQLLNVESGDIKCRVRFAELIGGIEIGKR